MIREKVLGEHHPDTAWSYNNLAGLYMQQRMEKEAEEFYKKSLAILEETLGERHPSIAVNYGNLAVLYKNQGKLTEAEELGRKALSIQEKILGTNHPNTIQTRSFLMNLNK